MHWGCSGTHLFRGAIERHTIGPAHGQAKGPACQRGAGAAGRALCTVGLCLVGWEDSHARGGGLWEGGVLGSVECVGGNNVGSPPSVLAAAQLLRSR